MHNNVIKFRAYDHRIEDWSDETFEADYDEDAVTLQPCLSVINTMYSGKSRFCGSRFTLQISTGLLDSDGNEIFVGDIISHKEDKPMVVCFGQFEAGRDDHGIEYCPIGFYVTFYDGGKYCINQKGDGYAISASESKIVGNDIENPELL